MIQTILNVVRGIEPWQVLKKMGIWRNGNTWSLGPHNNPIEITVNDIILGFKKHESNKEELQEWASFVLCADNFVYFDTEKDPRFDSVVGALWDISFGEDIGIKNLEALIRLENTCTLPSS